MAGPPFIIDTTHPAGSDLVSLFPTNEQANRANLQSWLAFLSNPTTGLLLDTAFVPGQIFPAGSTTFLVFYQATAPTGWVKQTTVNDGALRLVSGGTGGSSTTGTNFSSIFVNGNVGNTQLTLAQTPSHVHSVSITTGTESNGHTHTGGYSGTANSAGAHTHNIGVSLQPVVSGGDTNGYIVDVVTFNNPTPTTSAGAHTHTVNVAGTSDNEGALHTHNVSGNTASAGSDGTHTHTLNLAVTYSDVIICSRT